MIKHALMIVLLLILARVLIILMLANPLVMMFPLYKAALAMIVWEAIAIARSAYKKRQEAGNGNES